MVGVALLVAVRAAGADEVTVEAERRGDGIEVRARAVTGAPAPLIWTVLTDYEGLPRFIPGLSRSAVRERQGNRVVIDQAGEARFLIFSFPIEVRLEVTESPPASISSRAVSGNLKRMSGRYDIEPDPGRGGFILVYGGLIEPEFDLPPLVGVAALRGMVEEQFRAMVEEIERRSAAGSTK